MRARFPGGRPEARFDSVALGPVVWCAVDDVAPEQRVNPNVGDSIGLTRLLMDPVRVASVLDWLDEDDDPRDAGAEAEWYRRRARTLPRNGPLRDPAELRLVRGFEDVTVAELERMFTVRGDGRVSANRAPAWALASVSVLSPEDAERIVALRGAAPTLAVPDQVVTLAGIDLTLEEFAELTRRISFSDARRTLRFRGLARAGARTLEFTAVAVLQEREGELTVAQLEVR
jgi:hypothetical protein